MKNIWVACMISVTLSACSTGRLQSNIIQTSSDMAIVNAQIDKSCSQNQLILSAQRLAALATLKAGYDSYIIRRIRSSDYVIETTSSDLASRGTNNYHYNNNVPIIRAVSKNNQNPFKDYYTLIIQMFGEQDQGRQYAVNAKQMLGPKWKKIVAKGYISNCR